MNGQPEPGRSLWLSWRTVAAALVVIVVLGVLLARGCRRSPATSQRFAQSAPEIDATRRNELFDYAIDILNRLEEFDSDEMLKQAVDRLDRWVQDQEPMDGWQVDPMVTTLPEAFRELPVLQDLGALRFRIDPPHSDGLALQEAVWLRDLSHWIRGDRLDDVERASRMFDWTVRNILLDPAAEPPVEGSFQSIVQRPWETLILGHGTAAERAWVFILLARHQGLDAALIVPADSGQGAAEEQPPGLIGVLSQAELYLFDPELGLPIPAPGGAQLDEVGRLDIRPATLSQVVADDGLLRQLDLDDERPYPLSASQLRRAVALLEASPPYLAQRMKLVESRLAGYQKLVLTTDPNGQAKRIKQCRHVVEARLWTLPYRSILQETQYTVERQRWQSLALMPFAIGINEAGALWKGRSLHLKGRLDAAPSAVDYYQMARPSNRQLNDADMDDQLKNVFLMAKWTASYWLGLIAAHQGNDRAAMDYLFTRLVLVARHVPWTRGAVYNLARILEARDPSEAIRMYRADTDSPGSHGNLLRARWLESLARRDDSGDEPGDEPEEQPDDPTERAPKDAAMEAD